MINHGFHLVTLSPWPLLLSAGLLNLTLSGGASLHHFSKGFLVFIVTYLKDHAPKVRTGLREGFLLFVASEAMLFMAIFWSFFHSSLAPAIALGSVWPPIYLEILNPYEILLVNTLILLTSGATITLAHHGLYVIIGTIFIIVSYGRFFKFHLLPRGHFGFEAASWYWHFVDVIWLFLFLTIDIWGRHLNNLALKLYNNCAKRDHGVLCNNVHNTYYRDSLKHPLRVTLVSRNLINYNAKRAITSGNGAEVITSLQVILKCSIIFSILLSLLRILYIMRHQNKFILQIIDKSKKIFLSALFSISILKPILSFSYRVTNAFFHPQNERITDILTIVSGVTTGISFCCRIFFILYPGVLIMGKSLILLLFGINAAFRSIIGLGILLKTGILRQFLEQLGRNKPRPGTFGGGLSSHIPHQHNSNNSFNGSQSNGSPPMAEPENSQYYYKKESSWSKWNTGMSTIAALAASGTYIDSKRNDRNERDMRKRAEEQLERQRREHQVERDVSDFEIRRQREEFESELRRQNERISALEKKLSEVD